MKKIIFFIFTIAIVLNPAFTENDKKVEKKADKKVTKSVKSEVMTILEMKVEILKNRQFLDFFAKTVAAYKKAKAPVKFESYFLASGAEGFNYIIMSSAKSWGKFGNLMDYLGDITPVLIQVYGKEEGLKILKQGAESITKMTRKIYVKIPELSKDTTN